MRQRGGPDRFPERMAAAVTAVLLLLTVVAWASGFLGFLATILAVLFHL